MTGQQLKNSILQMAVQGKLVPQDPNDEPASVLLERIRKEKEQLIKEGKIKKEKNPSYIFKGADNLPYEKVGKNEPVCIADEVPFEIPDSWEWVTLKIIAVTELGKTLDKAKNQGDYKPYLCSINVYWSGIDLTTIKEARFEESELPKYKLKKGDLLICEGGDVGRSAIWENEQEMYYQNALHRVRFYGGVNPHYFRLLMEYYKGSKILDEQSKGMTIKHLVQSALNAIYFPLPPIQEQQRIVDKFQSLIPMLEQYNASEIKLSNLNTEFPNLLKKSILQEAVQGKLVPQDPNDEPASVLLERIRAEKQKLIAEGKIKKDKHESVIFRRDNSHYEKLDGIERCIDDEIPFDIPDSWCWSRLNSIVFNHGQMTPTEEFCYIDIGSIDNVHQQLNESENIIEATKAPSRARKIVEFGDILYSTVRPYLHNMCIVDKIFSCKPIASTGFAVMCSVNGIYNKYLFYHLLSPIFDSYANDNENSKGVAYPAINDDKLYKALIPIPPLNEQYKIVEVLEKLLPYCQKI